MVGGGVGVGAEVDVGRGMDIGVSQPAKLIKTTARAKRNDLLILSPYHTPPPDPIAIINPP